MFTRLRQQFISGGLSETEFTGLKQEINKANCETWIAIAKITGICFLGTALAAICFQEVRAYLILYFGMFIFMVLGNLWLCLLSRKQSAQVLPTVYLMVAALTFFGMMLGAVLDTQGLAVTFQIIMVCVPLMLLDRPWRIALLQLVAALIFIVLCLVYKTGTTQFIDIYNTVFFSIIAQFINVFIVCTKLRNLSMTQKAVVASQRDELTGLYNRNAYEHDLEHCLDGISASKFIYCSLDVNGLKRVNDTLGHQAGDELLQGAAACLQSVLLPYGKIYRIGGDEFAAIIYASSAEFVRLQEELTFKENTWCGSLVGELSISWGYAFAKDYPELSLVSLIKIADEKMYEAKAEHYRHKGVDRRNQAQAYNAVCNSYLKILEVNLTEDSYHIISLSDTDVDAQVAPKISSWWYKFGTSNMVYEDDRAAFLKQTSLEYVRKHFDAGHTSLRIFYRRKCGAVYRKCMLEMVAQDSYSYANQKVYLYVKEIDMQEQN